MDSPQPPSTATGESPPPTADEPNTPAVDKSPSPPPVRRSPRLGTKRRGMHAHYASGDELADVHARLESMEKRVRAAEELHAVTEKRMHAAERLAEHAVEHALAAGTSINAFRRKFAEVDAAAAGRDKSIGTALAQCNNAATLAQGAAERVGNLAVAADATRVAQAQLAAKMEIVVQWMDATAMQTLKPLVAQVESTEARLATMTKILGGFQAYVNAAAAARDAAAASNRMVAAADDGVT